MFFFMAPVIFVIKKKSTNFILDINNLSKNKKNKKVVTLKMIREIAFLIIQRSQMMCQTQDAIMYFEIRILQSSQFINKNSTIY